MRYAILGCFLISTVLWAAQEPASAPSTPVAGRQASAGPDDDDKRMPSSTNVRPDDSVITINGLCSDSAPSANQSCETRISRADFEKLLDAILPGRPQAKVEQLAKSYPELLTLAQEAGARGLDKNQRVQSRLAFARLQILSQELLRQIDEESANIPASEIEEYYRNHHEEFETATMERVFVPLRKVVSSPDVKTSPQEIEAASRKSELEMTKIAEALQAKAKSGADFFTLQKDAYAAADMTDVPPNPSLGQLRRSGLPPGQGEAFDLKAGDVSKVFTDSTGHYVYKVDSKQIEPLEKATEQIQRTLRRMRKEKAVQAIQQRITTVLNPDYFGGTISPEESRTPKSK